MKDKYNLSLEQNIFLAKKLLIDSIYHSAKLEGCNITFPDTQTILQGVSVANLKMSDVEVVLNLRDAWKYVLDNIKNPLNLDYICKINSFVSRNESLDWGVLRYGIVGISGTDYKPEIPVKVDVADKIDRILTSNKSITQKAIELFLWSCRSQLFWDGNKRTSLISANKLLISQGKGILMIEDKYLLEFNSLLTEFYSSCQHSHITEFLYGNCIRGMQL
ncbi:MAG: Fic family protein [Lutispora sp.]